MEKTKTKTNLIVLLVCFLSLLISLPVWLLAYLDTSNLIQNNNCTIYNNDFKVYGSILSFMIPLIIMMVMYCLTVKRLKIVLTEFKLKCQKNNMRLSIVTHPESEKIKKNKLKLQKQQTTIENKINNNNKLNLDQEQKHKSFFRLSKNNLIDSKENNKIEHKQVAGMKNNEKSQQHLSKNVLSMNSSFNSLNNKKTLKVSEKLKSTLLKSPKQQKINNNKKQSDKDNVTVTPDVSSAAIDDVVGNCNDEIKKLTKKNFNLDLLSMNSSNASLNNLKVVTILSEKLNSIKSNKSNKTNQSQTTVDITKNDLTGVQVDSQNVKGIQKSRFKKLVNKQVLANKAINALKLSRESTVVKNQQKAVKVLGIVLIIFLIAWGPFALINILSAVCKTCSISLFYLDIFTWFGKYLFCYINRKGHSRFSG
jgi:hypothetical protein